MKKNKQEEKEINLEKNILKNVYGFEAKRTYKTILILWIVFFIVQFLIVIIGNNVYHVLQEQQTLDLLQLFSEDFEIIQENFLDVLSTFYAESPQLLLFILFCSLLTLFGILFFAIKNFRKIKNRFTSLQKFYSQKATQKKNE